MAELKTKKTTASVAAFLNAIEDDAVRADAKAIDKLMREVTGETPRMWGTSIVGYGEYEYGNTKSKAKWMVTGFSPRKQNLTLYVMAGFDQYGTLMSKLGKHSTGKSCLYIKRLSDIHVPTLKKLVAGSMKYMRTRFPAS